jgi:hypothetical protein
VHKRSPNDDPCLSCKLLIEQRDRSGFLVCRSAEHKNDDILRPLGSSVFIAFNERVRGLAESTFE